MQLLAPTHSKFHSGYCSASLPEKLLMPSYTSPTRTLSGWTSAVLRLRFGSVRFAVVLRFGAELHPAAASPLQPIRCSHTLSSCPESRCSIGTLTQVKALQPAVCNTHRKY